MNSRLTPRSLYFSDLINDADEALTEAEIAPGDPAYGQLLAAMILSDALNGVRKALAQLAPASARP
jgi:hypothetical protein